MAGQLYFTLVDHSNEQSTIRLYTPDLTSANVDNYTSDIATGVMGDMRLAINGLTIMNHLRRGAVATVIADVATLPADVNAQRERKALVTFRDTVTGKTYSVTIPGFNMVGAVAGTDILDTSGAAWQSFITEFEANFVSELGNAVQVLSAKHIGRAS